MSREGLLLQHVRNLRALGNPKPAVVGSINVVKVGYAEFMRRRHGPEYPWRSFALEVMEPIDTVRQSLAALQGVTNQLS